MAQGNELYIIARTSGKGGEGDNGKVTTIASGKLSVPANLWKVIVVFPVGSNDVNGKTLGRELLWSGCLIQVQQARDDGGATGLVSMS